MYIPAVAGAFVCTRRRLASIPTSGTLSSALCFDHSSIFSWRNAALLPLDLLVTPFSQAIKTEGLGADHGAPRKSGGAAVPIKDETCTSVCVFSLLISCQSTFSNG